MSGRVLLGLLLVVLAVAATASCAGGQGGQGSQQAQANTAESVRVMNALSALPGISAATGGYHLRPEDANVFVVWLNVVDSASDADTNKVVDETVRLIWQSSIHPLHVIAVHVAQRVGSTNRYVRDVTYPIPQEQQQLEVKYGKRPVSNS
jgi:hypothetical protein